MRNDAWKDSGLDLGKYLEMAGYEDVTVMKQKHVAAVLVSPEEARLSALESLAGCIPSISEDEQRKLGEEGLGLS